MGVRLAAVAQNDPAARSITAPIDRTPFRANALEAGLGHEDWAFNLATVRAVVIHIAPEGTMHFIRRKPAGGRLAQSQAQRLLPNLEI